MNVMAMGEVNRSLRNIAKISVLDWLEAEGADGCDGQWHLP